MLALQIKYLEVLKLLTTARFSINLATLGSFEKLLSHNFKVGSVIFFFFFRYFTSTSPDPEKQSQHNCREFVRNAILCDTGNKPTRHWYFL